MRYMKKVIVFIMVCAFLFLVGCGNKNVLFKDDVYTITRGDQGVTVSVTKGAVVPNLHNAAKEYIDTDLPCLSILEYENNVLTVSSHDYDGDAKDDFKLWKLNCTDNITFKCITVVDDKGDVTVDNIAIPAEEYQYIGEYYTGGYVELNTNGEVSCVSFYGDTIIQ